MSEGETLEPKSIGKYEIETTLGSGSMGVVYRARDPEIGRVVAIKTLRNVYLGDDSNSEAMQRFRQESRSAGKLRHPNIVTVFEAGRTETGTPYIVMEFIDGRSLEEIIREDAPLDPAEALNSIALVGSAIDYAHGQGVIHRDIKPSNVILDARGNPFLLDFGVAKLTDTSLTPAGMVVGTPSYMAPEQIRGELLDGSTDLFALAVMTFELLTGKRPFPGTDFTTVVSNIIHQEPLTLAECGQSELPESLNRALRRALSKDKVDRPRSCLEFLAECGDALGIRVDGTGVVGYRPGVPWTTLRRPDTAVSPSSAASTSAPRSAAAPVAQKETANQMDETWHVQPRSSNLGLYVSVFFACAVVAGALTYVLAPQFFRGEQEAQLALEEQAYDVSTEPTEVTAIDLTPTTTQAPAPVVTSEETAVPVEQPVSNSDTTTVAPAVASNVADSAPTPAPTVSATPSATAAPAGSREQLRADLDPKVLVQNIQGVDPDASLQDLVLLAQHPIYTVRVAVLKSLVKGTNLRSREVLRVMVDALNDDEFLVRGFAVKTIASLNNEAALRLLQKRREVEKHDTVIKVLDEAIRKLSGPQTSS